MIGGGVVLVGNLAQFFDVIAFGGAIAGVAAIPVFAFEICFAGYMVIKGLRPHTDDFDDSPAPAAQAR